MSERISPSTARILSWYRRNKRVLPWRNTRDPYAIWLSEVILQQTRVNQGLPYYITFLKSFPTVFDLADADQQVVLRLWQGLGYYSRARNLHQCAKTVVSDYHGVFPSSYAELIKLPGIGPYTAAAIASIAFEEKVPVIDGNVYRVLARLFDIDKPVDNREGHQYFHELAMTLIPESAPGEFNQAIMEFGALQCIPRNPDCLSCDLQDHCIAYLKNRQHHRPVKQKKISRIDRNFNYLVIENHKGLYMNQRIRKDIWLGLYDFYLHESDSNQTDFSTVLSQMGVFKKEDIILNHINQYRHVLTHQNIHATFYHIRFNKPEYCPRKLSGKGRFYSFEEIKKLPKPVLIDKYLKEQIF